MIKEEDPPVSYIYMPTLCIVLVQYDSRLLISTMCRLNFTLVRPTQYDFNPYRILWFHCETINSCEYANMKIHTCVKKFEPSILMFLISCLWICLSLLRKITAYYDVKNHHTVLSLFQIYVSIWYSVQLFRGTRCNFNLSWRWCCAIEVSVALWLINEMYELTVLVLWFWSFTTQWQAQSCSECISSSVPDCHNQTLLPTFEQNHPCNEEWEHSILDESPQKERPEFPKVSKSSVLSPPLLHHHFNKPL